MSEETRRKIAVLVSNDLTFDQRVKKTCSVMADHGCDPILVGRELPDSSPYIGPGTAVRLRLKHRSGVMFYFELMRGLMRWLKTSEVDAIWANDLDTLLSALIVGRRKGLPVIYDSHEFFTEAAGLTGRPFHRLIWLLLEKYTVPKIGRMLTVNESIAEKFRDRYNIKVDVLRNMPVLQPVPESKSREPFLEFGIPIDLPILLLQGAFMDRDRGTCEAVDSLYEMQNVRLVLVGAGIEWEESLLRVEDPRLAGRLFCIPRLPYEKLRILTASADVGLSLDKGLHPNYLLSLPNKLFDFIHVGLPVVASPMTEVQRIVNEYRVGVVVDDVTPKSIAKAVKKVLSEPPNIWYQACMEAREKLHWHIDSKLIMENIEAASNQPWVK